MVSSDYENEVEETQYDFSTALDALKDWKRITRNGWNGKDMYLYLVWADKYPTKTEIAKKEFGAEVKYNAYIAMKNVQNTICMWSASNSDLLEKDWIIL